LVSGFSVEAELGGAEFVIEETTRSGGLAAEFVAGADRSGERVTEGEPEVVGETTRLTEGLTEGEVMVSGAGLPHALAIATIKPMPSQFQPLNKWGVRRCLIIFSSSKT
jgi:hypothetical protein